MTCVASANPQLDRHVAIPPSAIHYNYELLYAYTLAVFSGIADRSVIIISTCEYTAWSGLVGLHFSTGGLVWSVK